MGASEKTTEASLQRVQRELAKLQRRHIKLECHSPRGNLKFCGIKEREHESNEDTKDLLWKFLRTDLKIPKKDEESIQFNTVHRVSARRVSVWHYEFQATTDYCQAFQLPRRRVCSIIHQKPYERPQSWNFRRLSKGSRRNEEKAVSSIKSRQARKAYCIFQGRKAIIIDGSLYRGPETIAFPLYGH